MYLLFLFRESWKGAPLGGMKDFVGCFNFQHAAKEYVESQPWHKYSCAQIVEINMGLKAERCGGDVVVEYPILESLTMILVGHRSGYRLSDHWEWKKVKAHYPVVKDDK